MADIAVKQQFKRAARLGYSARGLIYLVVGGLAVMTALGQGGKTTNSKGALLSVHQQPFGDVMLGALILGLAGYVAWRFVQAIRDTDNHGTSFKGLMVRAGLLVSAITHSVLALWAVKILANQGDSGSSSGGSGILSSGAGQWIMAAIGVAVIGAGVAHLIKGWTARFERYMDIPPSKRTWARPICRFGLIARGVVWCMIGGFFLQSAWRANSSDFKGMEDALVALQSSAFGPWLLAIVAAGLFAFGIYSILEAVYRRVEPE